MRCACIRTSSAATHPPDAAALNAVSIFARTAKLGCVDMKIQLSIFIFVEGTHPPRLNNCGNTKVVVGGDEVVAMDSAFGDCPCEYVHHIL